MVEKKNDEPLTVDDDLLEEEERKALLADLEEEEELVNEEGKKVDAEGNLIESEETPEKGKKEGDGEDQDGEKKDGDEGDQEGEVDPLKDATPVKVEVDGEVVEGWRSKSGKYIIPFTDVEKRDEARRTLTAANEALEASNKALLAQIAEAKAKPPPEKEEPEEKLDFAEMGKKLYESEEGAAEVLEKVHKAGYTAGKADAGEEKPEGEVEGEKKPVTVDPAEIAAQVESKLVLKAGLEQIVKDNPKLQEPKGEFICYQLAMKALGEALDPMEKPARDEWVKNPENLLTLAKKAAADTLDLIGGDASGHTEEEKTAWRKAERKVIVKEVAKSLNLSETDRRTLGDIGDAADKSADANKELDDLEGEELEDALNKLSPQEKDDYLNSQT